jgi:predicted SAM-dependent methyltransferase
MKIRLQNAIFFKKAGLQKLINKPTDKKFLNLGSGPRGIKSDSWINIDGFKDQNVQYLCDFNKPMPFPDNTFDGIFCEHVLEHFDYSNGRKLLQECLRILKKGGVVRIVVPDGEKFMKAYFEDPSFIIKYKHAASGFAMEAINEWFYQRYEHQCIYDGAYLSDQLKKSGFSEAGKASYKQSLYGPAELLLDDEKYSWESLYVEGKK